MITKNGLQREIILEDGYKNCVVNHFNSGRAAKGVIRRISKMQGDIEIHALDIPVLNQISKIRRLGIYRDPFAGGRCGTKMTVSASYLRSWIGVK